MTPHFDQLHSCLKKLPGLGYRSAERLALHLLIEDRLAGNHLIKTLKDAQEKVRSCSVCGNLAEEETCEICLDEKRDAQVLCIVEHIPDLIAIERSSSFKGCYHVLQGKLSPLHGVGPEKLNLQNLNQRLEHTEVKEIILALSNDIEGEATCHYLQEEYFSKHSLKISRIGFGLPSGGGLPFADTITLRSAIEGRRDYE